MRYFEYRHVVGFAETNLVGNVYFAHYLTWQGRCREMFLYQHCPDVVAGLSDGLALVTTRCACDFVAELEALDHVSIRMFLRDQVQNRITMGFEYWRLSQDSSEGSDDRGSGERAGWAVEELLVAKGEQQVALLERRGGRLAAVPVPHSLQLALEAYRV